jgi:hypothetical protein
LARRSVGRALTTIMRNDLLALAVRAVMDCGFNEQRSAATKDTPSACSIVSEELDKLGVGLSEDGVLKAIQAHYAHRK